MRLFVGLDLPGDTIRNLERLLAILRPKARISWTAPANLHITTKFIGEWPEERMDELKLALGGLAPRGKIPVRIRRLGFFPDAQSPRIFWCGVDAPALETLAKDTDSAAAALGIQSEARSFSPHLTLGRIKDRLDMRPLNEAIAALPSPEFGAFEARCFFLYRSQTLSTGSVYTKLAEFPFSS